MIRTPERAPSNFEYAAELLLILLNISWLGFFCVRYKNTEECIALIHIRTHRLITVMH